MSEELSDRVAIVTGAGLGIGRAAALALADQGATCALFDKDADALAATAAIFRERGQKCHIQTIDLLEIDQIGPAVERVVEDLGRVDILANVAGIFSNDQILGLDIKQWQTSITVNLTAPAVLIAAVAEHLVRQGDGGRIVNVSSSAAFRSSRDDGGAAYSSGKAGLMGLTRAAAGQLAAHNINVNAVVPGLTASDLALRFRGADELQRMVEPGGVAENLLGRLSQSEDVAAAIVFLCLEGSRQITAQAIHTSAGVVV